MDNTEQILSQELLIQKTVNNYLNFRQINVEFNSAHDSHLDEDLLTAFVEGKLNRREGESALKHLTSCAFCRHITAELVKLDFALSDKPEAAVAARENEPTKISDVLQNLMSRLFGGSDGAVFAHEEKSEATEQKENTTESK